MKIVVDTNVLIESFVENSTYYKIFSVFQNSEHSLIITNEIWMEYCEIFERFFSKKTIKRFYGFFQTSPIINIISPNYRFNLISTDPDDNKFVDASICGNADFLITSDKHFDVLKLVKFPKVNVISPEKFINKFLI